MSVRSQTDTEQADIELERKELKADDKGEQHELMAIYAGRGLNPSLAKQAARQLMVHDAIGAHARDELGISAILRARSIQAALVGWVLRSWSSHPSLGHCDGTGQALIPLASGTSLMFLRLLRALAARGRRSGNVGCDAMSRSGATCHGADRRRWVAVRNQCVTGPNGC